MSGEENIELKNLELNGEKNNFGDRAELTIKCRDCVNKKLAKFSFIAINEVIQNSYLKQKDLILNALYTHPYFSKIGQIWQTLERGVNYPVIHYLPVNALNDNKCDLNETNGSLGVDFTVYEGLYEEIQRIQLPVIACNMRADSGSSHGSSSQTDRVYFSSHAYIFLGFKTLDTTFNSVLEESWKDWTGARTLYLNLSSDFGLSEICFFRRILPNELNTFMYILKAECTNINDKNRIMLLDFVDRFRLQRLCGYLTVYSHFSIPINIHKNSMSSSFDSEESHSVSEVVKVDEIKNDNYLSSLTPIDI